MTNRYLEKLAKHPAGETPQETYTRLHSIATYPAASSVSGALQGGVIGGALGMAPGLLSKNKYLAAAGGLGGYVLGGTFGGALKYENQIRKQVVREHSQP